METSRIGRVVVCRREVDSKATGQVKLFWFLNGEKNRNYLFQLEYKEMDELIEKLQEAKAKIDEERAKEKSLFRKIGDLVAVVQGGPHAGPEFILRVSTGKKPSRWQYTTELHIPVVEQEYRSNKRFKDLYFSTQAASFSDAMEEIRRSLAQHIKTSDYKNHCYEEIIEAAKKLQEVRAKIDEERAKEKKLLQKTKDLVAVIQESQPTGPEFTLKVSTLEKSGQDKYTVTIRIPMVKKEYRYAKDCEVLNFISQAASFSVAMKNINHFLAQYTNYFFFLLLWRTLITY